MDLSGRKLLLVPEYNPSAAYSTISHSVISSNTSSALIKCHEFTQSKINNEHNFNSNGTAGCTHGGFSSNRLIQPLDYSMALPALLLFTVFFFIGFFSTYVTWNQPLP